MKKLTASALALALAMGAGSAMANHHEGHMEEKFEMVDTNNDGMISKAEWDAKGDKMFNKMDADGNGNISKAEGEAFKEKMKAKWDHKGDHNKKRDMSDHDDKGNDHKIEKNSVER